jgi:predicted RNA-binding protein with PIN domain
MHYLIDGYNIIFAIENLRPSLQEEREDVITFFSETAHNLNISISLIFDAGSRDENLWPQKSFDGILEIVYTPHGQTADEYIIEEVQRKNKTSGPYTVVSSDKHLCMLSRHHGARTKGTESFLSWIKNKQKKKASSYEEKTSYTPPQAFEYYLKAFEKKMNEMD